MLLFALWNGRQEACQAGPGTNLYGYINLIAELRCIWKLRGGHTKPEDVPIIQVCCEVSYFSSALTKGFCPDKVSVNRCPGPSRCSCSEDAWERAQCSRLCKNSEVSKLAERRRPGQWSCQNDSNKDLPRFHVYLRGGGSKHIFF